MNICHKVIKTMPRFERMKSTLWNSNGVEYMVFNQLNAYRDRDISP